MNHTRTDKRNKEEILEVLENDKENLIALILQF